MDESIVSENACLLKDEPCQSAQESLCVKIEQARHLAKIGMDRLVDKDGKFIDAHLYHMLWSQSDLLNAAFIECEELTVHDFVKSDDD